MKKIVFVFIENKEWFVGYLQKLLWKEMFYFSVQEMMFIDYFCFKIIFEQLL